MYIGVGLELEVRKVGMQDLKLKRKEVYSFM